MSLPDSGVRCVVCGIEEWVVQFLFGGPMDHVAWSVDPWVSEPVCVRCTWWKEAVLG